MPAAALSLDGPETGVDSGRDSGRERRRSTEPAPAEVELAHARALARARLEFQEELAALGYPPPDRGLSPDDLRSGFDPRDRLGAIPPLCQIAVASGANAALDVFARTIDRVDWGIVERVADWLELRQTVHHQDASDTWQGVEPLDLWADGVAGTPVLTTRGRRAAPDRAMSARRGAPHRSDPAIAVMAGLATCASALGG